MTASRPTPISILFLGTQMERAGAQRVLLSLARGFSERGYRVQAVFFYDKQGLADEWQARYSFPLSSLKAWRYGAFLLANLFRLPGGLLRLWRLLRSGVQVVVSFTTDSNVLAMPLARLAGVPVRIATHHGLIEKSPGWLARLHGWMANVGLASRVVAVSAQVADYAQSRERMRAERLLVIENGIEALEPNSLRPGERAALRAELHVPQDALLLLTTGRLTLQKGHTILLEAIAQVGAQADHAVFVFAGDGPQRAALETRAGELGIAERVRFLGLREDVARLLLAADIFVQPSLWEGLSIAMLEALMAGAPVLATRVEGVVDVIEDGKTGILVAPNDAAALAEALQKMMTDGGMREKLGRAGRAHAEAHYTAKRMVDEYEALIGELVNGHA